MRVAAFVTRALTALVLGSATLAHAVDLMVPAYFEPGGSPVDYWRSLRDAQVKLSTMPNASGARIVAIFNPGSGPKIAATADPAYVNALGELRKAGGKVLAYIHTSYAARRLGDVTNDVHLYQQQYSNGTLDLIDGFFVDEMTSVDKSTYITYYQDLYRYINPGSSKRYLVVGNPGILPAERYVRDPLTRLPSNIADQFVVFEHAGSRHGSFRPAPWQKQVPPKTFVHLLYSASQAQMAAAFGKVATNWFGTLYVTRDGAGNPWDTLPMPYWDAQVQKAADTLVPQ